MNTQHTLCAFACLFMFLWIWTQGRLLQEPVSYLESFGKVMSQGGFLWVEQFSLFKIFSLTPLKNHFFAENTEPTLSPEEMKRRRLAYQQQIKNESEQRLQNMTEIRRQNSHVRRGG